MLTPAQTTTNTTTMGDAHPRPLKRAETEIVPLVTAKPPLINILRRRTTCPASAILQALPQSNVNAPASDTGKVTFDVEGARLHIISDLVRRAASVSSSSAASELGEAFGTLTVVGLHHDVVALRRSLKKSQARCSQLKSAMGDALEREELARKREEMSALAASQAARDAKQQVDQMERKHAAEKEEMQCRIDLLLTMQQQKQSEGSARCALSSADPTASVFPPRTPVLSAERSTLFAPRPPALGRLRRHGQELPALPTCGEPIEAHSPSQIRHAARIESGDPRMLSRGLQSSLLRCKSSTYGGLSATV